MADEQIDPVVEAYRLGNEFAEAVNAELIAMGGDCTSPEWFAYCAAMDELAGVTVAPVEDTTGSTEDGLSS